MKGKGNDHPRCCPCVRQQEINRIGVVVKYGKALLEDLDVVVNFLDGLNYTPYRVPSHVFNAMVDAVIIAQRMEKGGEL